MSCQTNSNAHGTVQQPFPLHCPLFSFVFSPERAVSSLSITNSKAALQDRSAD